MLLERGRGLTGILLLVLAGGVILLRASHRSGCGLLLGWRNWR